MRGIINHLGEDRDMGRPKKVLDEEQITQLASIGMSYQEIADLFGVARSTVIANYSDAFKQGYAEVKESVRRAQLKLALSGNATMLIWLGKQMLQQRDHPQEVTKATSKVKLGGKDE